MLLAIAAGSNPRSLMVGGGFISVGGEFHPELVVSRSALPKVPQFLWLGRRSGYIEPNPREDRLALIFLIKTNLR